MSRFLLCTLRASPVLSRWHTGRWLLHGGVADAVWCEQTWRVVRRFISTSRIMLAPERITEGSATVATGQKTNDKKAAAFYNPAQVINRDLSLCVIQVRLR